MVEIILSKSCKSVEYILNLTHISSLQEKRIQKYFVIMFVQSGWVTSSSHVLSHAVEKIFIYERICPCHSWHLITLPLVSSHHWITSPYIDIREGWFWFKTWTGSQTLPTHMGPISLWLRSLTHAFLGPCPKFSKFSFKSINVPNWG